jgi:hypothetical protein
VNAGSATALECSGRMKVHGQHVRVDVTPLRRYEDFAADVKARP